ncbi:MAG: OmpH family outer membrane protein [Bacteroidales bacterium]|nr:OmpH family outer membrane protein [Bacteroidales bacterium]
MKKLTMILGLAAAVSTIFMSSCSNNGGKTVSGDADTTAIAAGSIVYFDLDTVLDEYDMANDLRSEVETKVNAIQKDVNRRQKNLEDAVNDFNNKLNKGLMTSAVAAEQQQRLQQQDANFQQFAQQKQAEIMEEQQVMMNQIADAIKTFVEEYNAEKKYSMILSNQAGVPVITGDASLNITDEIIAGLNAKYVKTKNNKAE